MKIKQLEWLDFDEAYAKSDALWPLQYDCHLAHNRYVWVFKEAYKETTLGESDGFFQSMEDAKSDAQKHWEETLMQFIEQN